MKRIITLIAVSLVIGCSHRDTTKLTKLQISLDSLITKKHHAKTFGGTIVIGTKDSVMFEKAIGTANRVWNIRMRQDYRFDICSINKSFIANLILMAVEEGLLMLEDTLVGLLAEFKYTGRFDPSITIHQMLTHTAGLPDYGQLETSQLQNNARIFKRKHFTNAQYIDYISQLPIIGDPENTFYYSNFSYHLLAIILEDIYQMPLPELLEKKICQPLGLKNTIGLTSNTQVLENLVEAYNYEDETGSWKRNQFIDLTLGRRIFSTSYDLYLWGREMSNSSLLSQKSSTLMKTNHIKSIDPNISYGYGWVVFDDQGDYQMGNLGINRKYIIHGGSTEGFKSMLINIENGQYIIAILANTGDQTGEMVLSREIIDILIKSENEK